MKGHLSANWLIHDSQLTHDEVEAYARELTIPNPKAGLKDEPEELCFLFKQDEHFVFPRNLFNRRDFVSYTHSINKAKPLSRHKDTIVLRDYQIPFYGSILKSKHKDFVVNAPCGHGKTIMGIKLISHYNKKTLILLPTRFLMNQWKNAIDKCLPGVKVKLAKPSYKFSEEDDVVIMSLDLMSDREFPDEFYTFFGTVVMDEAHRMGARTYYPIISKVASEYRIALSATMRRKDGADKILMLDFGVVHTLENQFPPATVYALNTYCSVPLKKVSRFLGGKMVPLYSLFDSYIAKDEERNDLIFEELMKLHKVGRKVIFIGKRKEAIISMYKRVKEVVPDCVLVVSETNKEDVMNKVYEGADFIFGISQLAEEGLDCPTADTLFLHNPIGDCEQAVGRILRVLPGKKPPIVIYPVDDFFFSVNVFKSYQNNYLDNNARFGGYINSVSKVI